METSGHEVFDCLSASRFAVLLALIEAGEPLTTSRVAKAVEMPYMTAFRHLNCLEDEGLVEANIKQRAARQGKRVLYAPTDKAPYILDAPKRALDAAIAKAEAKHSSNI